MLLAVSVGLNIEVPRSNKELSTKFIFFATYLGFALILAARLIKTRAFANIVFQQNVLLQVMGYNAGLLSPSESLPFGPGSAVSF